MNNQPVIKLNIASIDKVFAFLYWVFVAAHWAFVIYKYGDLPDIIPIHSDLQGNIDGYGSKDTIWLLPAIGTVIVTGINWLCNFPHLYNYTVKITPDNVVQQYTMATRMLRFINMLSAALLFLISVEMIVSAKDGTGITQWLIIIFVVLAVLTPLIAYFVNSLERRKTK